MLEEILFNSSILNQGFPVFLACDFGTPLSHVSQIHELSLLHQISSLNFLDGSFV